MEVIHAFLYGIIQGLSEFLPVSSSGHLALLPYIFNFKDPGVFFDLMMHLGTALAVMIYFKQDVIELIKSTLKIPFLLKRRNEINPFAINFIFATIISVLAILLIKDFSQVFGRAKNIIAFNLIFFGIILGVSDFMKVKLTHDVMRKDLNLLKSFLIGLAQSIAIFPGVSRSGITITMGRFLNLSRLQASSFSFLLSLPIILAGAAKKLLELNLNLEAAANFHSLFLGLVVSFIVGLLTIHYFMKLITKIPLYYFSIYRVILGVILLYI